MDPHEILEDRDTALDITVRDHMAKVWTGFPGIIQSFDAEKMTVEVQPAIKTLKRNLKDGSTEWISMPLLKDCPVLYPMGGKTLCSFPITKGDECMVHIADRCIDAWWQSGGEQNQMELRLHNLSDGFVFVGCWSKPNWIKDISTTTAQFRSDDGDTYVEISPDDHHVNIVTKNGDVHVTVEDGDVNVNVTGGDVNIETDQNVTITCSTCTVNADTVNLGGEGGQGVARIGDATSDGATIVGGSSKVFAT